MATGVLFKPTEAESKYINPDNIYHYTSTDGLLGIFINNEIWFSRFDCLNDIEEGRYILKPYQMAIGELKGKIEASFLNEIANLEPDFMGFFRVEAPIKTEDGVISYHAVSKDSTPYICCFSKNSDSLPMWNYYTKNNRYEGYNIGFDWKTIKEIHEDIQELYVIYEESDQISILKNHIEEAYANFSKYRRNLDLVKIGIKRVLSTRGLQFKNPAFMHEEEFRLIYWRPESDDGLAEKSLKLSFRQTKGIVIPYVKGKDVTKAIRSVTIGPLIKKEVAEKILGCLMRNKGVSVPVYQSTVPIRY